MPKRWTKVKLAYEFLSDKTGQEVTASDIASVTSWEMSTVKTYIAKKWAGLLEPVSKKNYLVKNIDNVSWEDFKVLHSQVVIPSITPTPSKYDYEVALSFAGEDRLYVEEVAEILKSYDIPIFYDAYESTTLWGKDLYLHLDEVYRVRSRFCIMFLSINYANKLWTNHEMKSAQARAFEEKKEYLLPVKIDDTEIPGIRTTIAYLDAREKTPAELANIVAEKLGYDDDFKRLLSILNNYLAVGESTGYTIKQDGAYLQFDCPSENFQTSYSTKMLIEAMRSNRLDDIIHGLFVL